MKRKKKETPYLDFYERCMEDEERLPIWDGLHRCNGLCPGFHKHLGDDSLWELKVIFQPSFCNDQEETDLTRFWASGDSSSPRCGEFTPLRQNIVLFLSCMNDEY